MQFRQLVHTQALSSTSIWRSAMFVFHSSIYSNSFNDNEFLENHQCGHLSSQFSFSLAASSAVLILLFFWAIGNWPHELLAILSDYNWSANKERFLFSKSCSSPYLSSMASVNAVCYILFKVRILSRNARPVRRCSPLVARHTGRAELVSLFRMLI